MLGRNSQFVIGASLVTCLLTGCLDVTGSLVTDGGGEEPVADGPTDADTEVPATCVDDGDCDDGNPCTQDVCEEGPGGASCVHTDAEGPCDDGNPCTDPDTCEGGACMPGPGICDCETDGDCAEHDDGDLCNGTFVCEDNLCVIDPESVVFCPPGDACAPLVCQPETGLCLPEIAAPGTTCESDGDACTDDLCDASGTCLHEAITCDDSEECTDDTCHPTTGCVYTARSGPCDDGDPCTEDDVCYMGACQPGTYMDCDDGDPCTTDLCVAGGDCDHVFNTAPCDDGDPCTGPDLCDGAGACLPGDPLPVWYRDADGDTVGVASDTACGATAPSGYAADHGDCCDALADVFPGQGAWFADAYVCPGSSGSPEIWDYDCNGNESRRWTNEGWCEMGLGWCGDHTGWDLGAFEDPPECGDSATWILDCGGTWCDPTSTESRRQECH